MNVRHIVVCSCLASLAWTALQAAGGGRPQTAGPDATRGLVAVSAAAPTRAILDQYCVSCHNARIRSGALALDTLDVARIGDSAEIFL